MTLNEFKNNFWEGGGFVERIILLDKKEEKEFWTGNFDAFTKFVNQYKDAKVLRIVPIISQSGDKTWLSINPKLMLVVGIE